MSDPSTDPPTRIRLTGRALNALVARAPWSWPLVRPAMRRFFDAAAGGWDQRTGAGSVDHLTPLSVAVAELGEPPERVLDVGTGTGEAALFLAREFPRASIRGIDVSEEMVRAARAKVGLDPEGRIAFRVADAAELPYEAESFDLITHVNVPPFFGEIARVLRPGGHVVFVATRGPATPFYTPPAVLQRGLARHGIETTEQGEAGRGTYLVARAAL